ncbi:cob(I)yrinic acid a,c-diamide adenosyltransferase [Weeksellaceae bacterium TAE3-ERU29]|nr:cob(I)yrinic acid a,c-diamide adenosyltransferase [Weeksellaceae bacterium TAE3-ERU29]
MKIYTKQGDKGQTSLYGGLKVSKADLRIEAYGTIDEINSVIGCIVSENTIEKYNQQLIEIQNNLFCIGAELATPSDKLETQNGKSRIGKLITENETHSLENYIDEQQKNLPQLTHFILPGGGKSSAITHLSRTVCRRAERIIVRFSEIETVRPETIQYINRLSDYLFTLARTFAKENGIEETKWIPEK